MDGTSPGFRPSECQATECQAAEPQAAEPQTAERQTTERQASPRQARQRYAGQRYDRAGIEPPVEELLADPIVHRLLVRDRITLAETRRAVSEARRRLGL